jgi:hypothetical protein
MSACNMPTEGQTDVRLGSGLVILLHELELEHLVTLSINEILF